jgi:hypothetical protein
MLANIKICEGYEPQRFETPRIFKFHSLNLSRTEAPLPSSKHHVTALSITTFLAVSAEVLYASR